MTAILVFFVAHWQLSVFCQTFFLHRYAAHKQFTMSPGWERFFYLFTYLCQGSSFLVPRGYAILHRMHHAYSDTPKDPHSPRYYTNALTMMWRTKKAYDDYAYQRVEPEPRFGHDLPQWPLIDRIGQSWLVRSMWIAGYSAFYFAFASSPWLFLLLPAHFVMGPIHGAIVNWCGHKYGYRNFAENDDSRNTLVFDFVTLGELFQNNHHRFAMSPNFAARRFEVDPTYFVIRALAAFGIIHPGPQRMRYPDERGVAGRADAASV
ncbi:MAG: acyl-CoA desaturase [Myxococcales bacterium FL481]|nr:MAG: acyl-CoA desaturase [Myxococcales bacterium FL481]